MTPRIVAYCIFSVYLAIAVIINAWQHNVAWTIANGFLWLGNIIFDYFYFKDKLVRTVHDINIKGMK